MSYILARYSNLYTPLTFYKTAIGIIFMFIEDKIITQTSICISLSYYIYTQRQIQVITHTIIGEPTNHCQIKLCQYIVVINYAYISPDDDISN